MGTNDYRFLTRWRVEGTLDEVARILADAQALPRWWPAVYLDVQPIAAGDERGVGTTIELWTKGWLPYTLRWQARMTDLFSDGFRLEASGDFNGRGIWTLRQNGPYVDLVYDWKLRADKPLLRYGSWLFRPIFAANHEWAMRQGLRSLELELRRRRATTQEQRAAVPAPPQPTSATPLLATGFAAIAVLAVLARRAK